MALPLNRIAANAAVSTGTLRMGALGMIAAGDVWLEIRGAGLPLDEAPTRLRQLDPDECPGARGIHFDAQLEPYGPTWAVEAARALLHRCPVQQGGPTDEGVEALLAEAARDADVKVALVLATRQGPLALLRLYSTLMD